MKKKLSEQHYRAYKMIFFEKSTEEDVASFMGYKISASNAKLGYRQVKNLKRKFYEVALNIINEQDIFGHETDK